jgi:hypothetical protein
VNTEVSKWQRVIVSKIQRSSTKEKGSRVMEKDSRSQGVKGSSEMLKIKRGQGVEGSSEHGIG